MLMDLVPDDKTKGLKTPVWDEYKKILNQASYSTCMYINTYCMSK